jgi:hypothetical protein
MALDISPTGLWTEIDAAERARDRHLAGFAEQIANYHGPHYVQSEVGEVAPENHAFEYLSLTVPRCVADNPRTRVGSRRGGLAGVISEGMRHSLDRWARDSDVQTEISMCVRDMLARWGCSIVTQEPDARASDTDDPPYWPVFTRLSPHHVFWDAAALQLEQCRLIGHKYARDKDDLLELARSKRGKEEGWNAEVIEELVLGMGVDELGRPKGSESLMREEVVLYEVWVPENQIDGKDPKDGYHGTIYTLSPSYRGDQEGVTEEGAKLIREPQAYYGPRWGPYQIWGSYTVPDSTFPLGQLTATEHQTRELNSVANGMSVANSQYKRMVLVDDTDPDLQEKLEKSGQDYVVPIGGLAEKAGRNVVPIEMAGLSEHMLAYSGLVRDRLDRVSGIHDAQRGVVTGRGTATEVSAASEASEVRTSWAQKMARKGGERALSTVGWYLYEDDRVFMELGPEAASDMGVERPLWFGGRDYEAALQKHTGLPKALAEEVAAMLPEKPPFDDLELEIEMYSMTRVSEAQQKQDILGFSQLVANVAQLIPQTPFIDWGLIFKSIATSMHKPELGEIVDMQAAAQQRATEQTEAAAQTQLGRSRTTGEGGGAGPPIKAPPKPQAPARLTGNTAAFAQRNTTAREGAGAPQLGGGR